LTPSLIGVTKDIITRYLRICTFRDFVL